MILDFEEEERKQEMEVGDLVKDRDGDVYLIVYDDNAIYDAYSLIDISDCQVFKAYDSLEQIEGYTLFKRKNEYKLTDN